LSRTPTTGPRKGRGAPANRSGRYEALARESFDDGWGTLDETPDRLATTLTEDASRSALSFNESPDISFDRSLNPYRGCEHGCIYCYARPTHAWLGMSPGLDFESRLTYKPAAPALLEAELSHPRYACAAIALGTNTDVYQPAERRLGITRSILELLSRCEHPVMIVTKSALVERDIDLLASMAERGLAGVHVSVTTLDHALARRMEPRATAPLRRLKTIQRLAQAGIPTGVMVAPVIPALNDPEIESILERARELGATMASHILLRLPLEVRDLFVAWLRAHYPLKADHVMSRVRDTRGGRDNDPAFGRRMSGVGPYAEIIARRVEVARARLGFGPEPALDCTRFQPPRGQLALL
jgi:DNA repair photolyase